MLQKVKNQSKAMRKEIDERNRVIQELGEDTQWLSMERAFIYPFGSFAFAFASSVLGISIYQPSPSTAYVGSVTAGVVSTLFLLCGGWPLYKSLRASSRAVLGPETRAALQVTFQSGLPTETFTHSRDCEVTIAVYNFGTEMAQETVVHLYFPPEFKVGSTGRNRGRTSMEKFRQSDLSEYPCHTTLRLGIEKLHADLSARFSVWVKMPNRPSMYIVPFTVWEKKLGASDSALTFNVT
jgi:hypothetical protein